MKVFGYTERDPEDGLYKRRLVACKFKKEAVELLGVSLSYFNNYICQTGNKKEIELAEKTPFKAVWGDRF